MDGDEKLCFLTVCDRCPGVMNDDGVLSTSEDDGISFVFELAFELFRDSESGVLLAENDFPVLLIYGAEISATVAWVDHDFKVFGGGRRGVRERS